MTSRPIDPFDPAWLRHALDETFLPIVDHWFRPTLLGAEKLPSRGPLIVAPNHSGTAFPFDGMVLDALLWRHDGMEPARKFRSLYEKMLSQHWWMRPFGVDDFWRRCGGVDLTFDNFDRLLAQHRRLIYYPEGVPGIGKGFARRYQLQRFRTSFVLLAARHRAPVYPVHVVNAEWIVPFNFTCKPLDRMMQRVFGVPFLPLPGALFAIVFPWAWYLALPARLVFVVGSPIDVRQMLHDDGVQGDPATTEVPRAALDRVAGRIRRSCQADLDRMVEQHGQQPYDLPSLRQALARAHRLRQLARALPTGWPAAFAGLERQATRPVTGRLARMRRDWDLLAFHLPFGWPLLSITRAARRPPCGYRGLSRAESKRRQGNFVWHLAERPLPAPVSPAAPADARAVREHARDDSTPTEIARRTPESTAADRVAR